MEQCRDVVEAIALMNRESSLGLPKRDPSHHHTDGGTDQASRIKPGAHLAKDSIDSTICLVWEKSKKNQKELNGASI